MAVNTRELSLFPFHLPYTFISKLGTWIQSVKQYISPGNPKSLVNEIILVTGGGTGIGREICVALAKEEKNLAIISWDTDEIENGNTIEILKGLGVERAHAYTVDVSDVAQVAAAAAKVRQEVGNVTMLFNNAGIFKPLTLSWDTDASDVKKIFDSNVLSHMWTFREFFPNMVKQRRGHIIEIRSISGWSSLQPMAEYQACECAIHGYFEGVKSDLDSLKIDDIHITFAYPTGNVGITGMMRSLWQDFPRRGEPLTDDRSIIYDIPKIIYGIRRNEFYI